MADGKGFIRDAAERVVTSFAAGMVAVVGAVGVDLTDGRVWLGGALAGAVSVLKCLAARNTGDPDSAGL